MHYLRLKTHNLYYHTNISSMYYVLLFSLHARSYAEVSSMTFPFPGLGYGNFFLGKCTGTQFRKLSNFVSNLVLFGWCRLHKRKKKSNLESSIYYVSNGEGSIIGQICRRIGFKERPIF